MATEVDDREADFEAARTTLRVAFDLTIMFEDMTTRATLEQVRGGMEERKASG